MKPQYKNLLIVLDFPNVGGAERVALQIASHIGGGRFTPVVVAPPDGILSRELHRSGVRTAFIDLERLKKSCRFVLPVVVLLARLVRLVKRERIDLIHANSLWALKFCTVASLLTNVPTVAMIHAYPRIRSRLKNLIHILTRRFCYARARRIIAVSKALKEALIADKAPPEKIVVIPNGVEAEWFTNAVDLPKGPTKTILTVGRLHPGKGQQVFLEAAAIVHAKSPDTEFVIAGEEYRTSLEDLNFRQTLIDLAQRLGIANCVEFKGYTAQLRELYDRASVVVVPSFEETFGLTAVEAMARGRPVVASRIPGIAELVQDGQTGLLFEAGSHEALAAKVFALLSDDALASQLARNGLAAADSQHRLADVLKRLQEVYAAALGGD